MGYDFDKDNKNQKYNRSTENISFDMQDVQKSYYDLKISKSHSCQKEKTIDGLIKTDITTFAGIFQKTKEATSKNNNNAWRVSDVDPVEFQLNHNDAACYLTPKNSTVAVTKDGDIVAVCKHPDDDRSGKDIIAMAVKAGGTKLDSYDGNHRFYMKCGFEPVSWCKWDDRFAPSDWQENTNEREDIIFYRYTGNSNNYIPLNDFKANVNASADYDTAMQTRDDAMKRKDEHDD